MEFMRILIGQDNMVIMKAKSNSEDVSKLSHFLSCKNKVFLVESYHEDPIERLAKLEFNDKTIILFSAEDIPDSPFPLSDVLLINIRTWIQISIFLKRLTLPVDYIIINRADMLDSSRNKRDRGRIRKPIIACWNEKFLKGTNVIITSVGGDRGLQECCDINLSC